MRCACNMHISFLNMCTFFNHHIIYYHIPQQLQLGSAHCLLHQPLQKHRTSISSWGHPIRTSLPKHKSIHWRFRYPCWMFANSLGSQIHELVIAYGSTKDVAKQTHIYSIYYIQYNKYTVLMYSELWLYCGQLYVSLSLSCRAVNHRNMRTVNTTFCTCMTVWSTVMCPICIQ